MSGKFKNYKEIYEIIKKSGEEQCKQLYEIYTGTKAIGPEGIYTNWALEATKAMAVSDGLTDDELDENFDW